MRGRIKTEGKGRAGMQAVLDVANVFDYAAWYFWISHIGHRSSAGTPVLAVRTPISKETPDAIRIPYLHHSPRQIASHQRPFCQAHYWFLQEAWYRYAGLLERKSVV